MNSSRSNEGTRSVVPRVANDGQFDEPPHTGPDPSCTEPGTNRSVDHARVRKVLSPPFLVAGTSLLLGLGLTLGAVSRATHQPTLPVNSQVTDRTTAQQTQSPTQYSSRNKQPDSIEPHGQPTLVAFTDNDLTESETLEPADQSPDAPLIEKKEVTVDSGNQDTTKTAQRVSSVQPEETSANDEFQSWIKAEFTEKATSNREPNVQQRIPNQEPLANDQPQTNAKTKSGELSNYGTAIQWVDQPNEAFTRASNQDKLVFLIHISGNFKIPGFT